MDVGLGSTGGYPQAFKSLSGRACSVGFHTGLTCFPWQLCENVQFALRAIRACSVLYYIQCSLV